MRESGTDLVEIHGQAKEIARRFRTVEASEDIAQEVVLARLRKSKRSNQYLVFSVRDAIRVLEGGIGSSKNDGVRASTPIDKLHLAAIDPSRIEDYLGELNKEDRAMIVLRFVWGMDTFEIGDVFGMSRNRVSERLLDILKGMKE